MNSNIDEIRDRIMALECAEVFDEGAWGMVIADLRAAGRLSALADAERRMATARSNARVLVGEIGAPLVLSVPVESV